MKKIFYVQTDTEKRITDVIEFPHGDYVPVELETPLPPKILGGAYELMGDSVIYCQNWDNESIQRQVENVQTETDRAIAEITMIIGGLSNV